MRKQVGRRGKVQETSGDVLRINVTPFKGKKTTRPWVRIFVHPHGIRHAANWKALEEGPSSDESKVDFAQMLGLSIIRRSKILKSWFK